MSSELSPIGQPESAGSDKAGRVGSRPAGADRALDKLAVPRVLDHELLRCIDRGSYGEVWLARNIMGTYRAVKVVYRSSFDHDRPFEREFEGFRRFEPISRTHESQLSVLHIGRGDGYFYYVMELADDQGHGQEIDPGVYAPRTLRSDLHLHGRLPFEQCLRIALALTTALDHLHQHGLVHRDIKPSNVIFVNGIPKLADIGLVARADATLSFVGTEGYVPPEGPGSPQADLFSLGKLLYEISTGRDRQDYPELPTDLRELPDREGIVELNEVIVKACHAEPRRRYATARAIHDDLVLLQGGKSLARIRSIEHSTARLKRVSFAIAAAMLVAIAGFIYQRLETAETRRQALIARQNLYAADINLAQQALGGDNLRQARDLLQKQIPKPGESDLRGFEWRYLWQQCQSEELFSLPGHEHGVNAVAFSPDGRTLATASRDLTIKIWDLATRRETATLTGHTNLGISVLFSPQGEWLVTADDKVLWLWDAKNLQKLRVLPGGRYNPRFSPDGKYLVAGGLNDSLVVYDTLHWNLVRTFEPKRFKILDENPHFALAFSPDSHLLAVVSDGGTGLFGFPDFREIGMLKLPGGQMPRDRFVSFSPDGQTLAVCDFEQSHVQLWDVETQKKLRSIATHSDSVFDAVFSPDGNSLATCSPDQTVKLWNVATGELVRTFKGHSAEVWHVAFSPDSQLLASVSSDGAVKLWDLTRASNHVAELPSGYWATNRSDFFLPSGFDSDGNFMAFDGTGKLMGLNPETFQRISTEQIHDPLDNSGSASVLFGYLFNDGRTGGWLVGGGENYRAPTNRFDVFDRRRREFVCSVECADPKPAFAPSKQLLATVTSNQTVTVWQLPQASRKFVLPNADAPLAFSQDGSMLATSDGERSKIKLWSLTGGYPRQLPIPNSDWLYIDTMAFSPDNAILAIAVDEGFVELRAVPSGRLLGTLTGHKRSNFSIAFSPDGRTLASMTDDRTVRLWHVETQRELMRFQLPMDAYAGNSLGFSPDGRSLLAVRSVGFLTRLYHAPSFPEIALAEGTDYRPFTHTAIDWHTIAKALEKQNRLEESVQAFGQAIQKSANQPGSEDFRSSALLHRAKLLSRLGRMAEAGQDNCAALDIPPRDPSAPPQLLDLSAFFTASLERDWLSRNTPFYAPFPTLPRGRHSLSGSPDIEFDFRGLVQLSGADSGLPHAAEGVLVRQKCRGLHFLHATFHAEVAEKPIGTYVIHYANRTQEEIPIQYGRDLLSWIVGSDKTEDLLRAKIAWTGSNKRWPRVRLFDLRWENPHPEVEIQTLDFVFKMSGSAPFLIAITAER